MGKHHKTASRKWGPYVTTGIALEAAALFAFTYATDSHVALNPLLAATTAVFVDGTKSLTGHEKGISPYRMTDALLGTYDQTPTIVDTDNSGPNKFVIYPRSVGPLTGFGDPTYDVSEGIATANTVQAIRDARKANPTDKIIVVGYSQGAGGVAEAIGQLEADSAFDTSNIDFVLAANPRRNDGGILTRFPAGVYVPIVGVTFGGGTSPQTSNVLQITKQYDGVADAPKYLFNVVADLNAALGYVYLHGGYYETVDPTDVPNIDPVTGQPDRIVSTSTNAAGGTITDVLVKAPVGGLPLTMPLLQLGVPRAVIEAIDPFLRAVIETAYDRPDGPGTYPTEPVPSQLAPPVTHWLPDARSVAVGAAQTGQDLLHLVIPAKPVAAKDVGNRSAPVADQLDVAADTGSSLTPNPSVVPKATPLKFEPPRASKGGWKPGDLLRHVITPTSVADHSSQGATTTPTPQSLPASTEDSSDPSADATRESTGAATP
ncbi:PE-PPE domain-containing protein [Mycolicibacterium hodleri]|uniref:PE-PPE domain-containing protein n=1 Tax=Mycolicibacterium hodleri TaxID=49897 RepID=UPI001375E87A|nr:PE-PPE domain-containing protein [Mycolicibacterium hodleri]